MATKRGKNIPTQVEPTLLPVARRLRLTREAIQGNRRIFAESMGLPDRRWEQYERGASKIEQDTLAKFCREWYVTADWILLGRIDTLPPGLVTHLYRRDHGKGQLEELIWTPDADYLRVWTGTITPQQARDLAQGRTDGRPEPQDGRPCPDDNCQDYPKSNKAKSRTSSGASPATASSAAGASSGKRGARPRRS